MNANFIRHIQVYWIHEWIHNFNAYEKYFHADIPQSDVEGGMDIYGGLKLANAKDMFVR